MCYSMNVLFKWAVPTDCKKSVSGCEQGKKVRKGIGEMTEGLLSFQGQEYNMDTLQASHIPLPSPHVSPLYWPCEPGKVT